MSDLFGYARRLARVAVIKPLACSWAFNSARLSTTPNRYRPRQQTRHVWVASQQTNGFAGIHVLVKSGSVSVWILAIGTYHRVDALRNGELIDDP